MVVLGKQDGVQSSMGGSNLIEGSTVKWEQSVGTGKDF